MVTVEGILGLQHEAHHLSTMVSTEGNAIGHLGSSSPRVVYPNLLQTLSLVHIECCLLGPSLFL